MSNCMTLRAGEVAIVGTDRGGVGKTMTAEVIITRMEAHGVSPLIIEVESEPRLGQVLADRDVLTIRVAKHSPEDLERDPALLYEVWEQIGDTVLGADRPVVIDLGANLTRAAAAYLNEVREDGPFGDGAGVWFFGVTAGDRFSLNSVNHGFAFIAQALAASHRWLVINETNARFHVPNDSPPVQAMRSAHSLRGVLRLPPCLSPALQTAVDSFMPMAMAAAKPADFWVECGYGPSEARRATRRFRAFLADAMSMLDPVFPARPALVSLRAASLG
jgi:hypothetical protein